IEPPVARIHALDRIAFGPIDPVVVELFQVHFPGRVVYIVLVRRIAGPVTAGGINLHNQEPLSGKLWRDNVIYLAGGIGASPNFNSNIRGLDERGRVRDFRLTIAEGEVAIADGSNCKP